MLALVHFLLMAGYVVLPPVIGIGTLVLNRHSRRAYRKASRQVMLAVMMALALGFAGSTTYGVWESREVSASQILLTSYWAAGLLCILKIFDAALEWFLRWVLRVGRGSVLAADRYFLAQTARIVLLFAIGLPYMISAAATYRPRAVPKPDADWTSSGARRVQFTSTDGVWLSGLWMTAGPTTAPSPIRPENPGSRTAIICRESSTDASACLPLAKALQAIGYNVLTFDFRGQGRSQGHIISFGPLERFDVLGALRWVRSDPAQAKRVVCIGVGSGSAALLTAAAQEDRDSQSIAALALFGGYDRYTTLTREISRRYFVPPLNWLIPRVGLAFGSVQTGQDLIDFSPASAAEQFAPRPILFIQSRSDSPLRLDLGENLYEASSAPKFVLPFDGDSTQALGDPGIDESVAYFLDQAGPMLSAMILLDRLKQQFPKAKRQTLKRMVQAGRVRVNGAPATRLNQAVETQDVIRVDPAGKSRAGSDRAGDRPPFAIVYEDADILVIDKPAGLLTSGGVRQTEPTALAAATRYAARKDRAATVGLVHRLDRDASGLLIFSKNRTAFASLKRQFFHHSAKRQYLAVVSPPPKDDRGTIESRLVEHADGTMHTTRLALGKRAVTHYQVIETDKKKALLRVRLETGRKHQIRAQLSQRGSAIVGDVLYGGLDCRQGLLLAAVELSVQHPRTGKAMAFAIPVPDRIARWKAT